MNHGRGAQYSRRRAEVRKSIGKTVFATQIPD
jgi:hypothetical protein